MDVGEVVSTLLRHYNLGIPADRVLLELTYPQIFCLLENIGKENKNTQTAIGSSGNTIVVNDLSQMGV